MNSKKEKWACQTLIRVLVSCCAPAILYVQANYLVTALFFPIFPWNAFFLGDQMFMRYERESVLSKRRKHKRLRLGVTNERVFLKTTIREVIYHGHKLPSLRFYSRAFVFLPHAKSIPRCTSRRASAFEEPRGLESAWSPTQCSVAWETRAASLPARSVCTPPRGELFRQQLCEMQSGMQVDSVQERRWTCVVYLGAIAEQILIELVSRARPTNTCTKTACVKNS